MRVTGGTLGTSWGLGTYCRYVLGCRDVLSVRPVWSGGTLGTSWGGRRYFGYILGAQEVLGTSWGGGRYIRYVLVGRDVLWAVAYTHLTLPTNREVEMSVVAGE